MCVTGLAYSNQASRTFRHLHTSTHSPVDLHLPADLSWVLASSRTMLREESGAHLLISKLREMPLTVLHYNWKDKAVPQEV